MLFREYQERLAEVLGIELALIEDKAEDLFLIFCERTSLLQFREFLLHRFRETLSRDQILYEGPDSGDGWIIVFYSRPTEESYYITIYQWWDWSEEIPLEDKDADDLYSEVVLWNDQINILFPILQKFLEQEVLRFLERRKNVC